MVKGDEKIDLVADTLATQFSRRTFHEKPDLVIRNRLTPTLTT